MAVKKADLSIIVINYNTRQMTADCIKSICVSLENADFQTEIILIDNHSKDQSVEHFEKMVKTMPANVALRVVGNKDNLGFAKANNQGAKLASGDYLLLLNSDILVLDDAIPKLFHFYKQHPEVRFLGGKLFNRDMTPQASSAPFYTPPVVFAALFLRGDYWGLTRNSPDRFSKTGWVSGACILAKKEYYDQINGFDEGIFMYMDEVDLLYRASRKGLATYFYPEARFIHFGSASSQGKTYPILQVYRGFLYFYKKHYSATDLFLLRIMLQLKAVVSIIIGYIINNSYLKKTYVEAFTLAGR